MVGGCCVCADERGWDENPLVYCDGEGCNVAVHQGEETFISCEVDCIIQTVNIGPPFPYQRMHCSSKLSSHFLQLAMGFYLSRPGRGIAESANRKKGLPEW